MSSDNNQSLNHWQTSLTSVCERMSFLRSSGKLSDLTITFPGQEKVIHSHKWMLAASSPVFEAMLFGPLAEEVVLNLPDDPPDAFEWILDHLYCDKREFPDMAMAKKVYKLADKYELIALCDLCSKYLCKEAHADNLPLLYDLAYLVQDNLLLECCEKILLVKTDDVLKSKFFSDLSIKSLKFLMKSQNFRPTSSLLVLEYLTEWAFAKLLKSRPEQANYWGAEKKYEEEEQEAEKEQHGVALSRGNPVPSPQCLRQCLESLLPFVDFMSLSVDDFVEHVVPLEIFSPEESISVLQGIKDVPGVKLPTCVSPRKTPKPEKQEASASSVVLATQNLYTGQTRYVTYHISGDHILFNIEVSHPISLTEIQCRGVASLCQGTLSINLDNAIIGKGVWINSGCKFESPVQLANWKAYKVNLKIPQAWWAFKNGHSSLSYSINVETNGIRIIANTSVFDEIRIKYIQG